MAKLTVVSVEQAECSVCGIKTHHEFIAEQVGSGKNAHEQSCLQCGTWYSHTQDRWVKASANSARIFQCTKDTFEVRIGDRMYGIVERRGFWSHVTGDIIDRATLELIHNFIEGVWD